MNQKKSITISNTEAEVDVVSSGFSVVLIKSERKEIQKKLKRQRKSHLVSFGAPVISELLPVIANDFILFRFKKKLSFVLIE